MAAVRGTAPVLPARKGAVALSVFEEATPSGERTVAGCACDADARGAVEARTCPACGWSGSVDALLARGNDSARG